MKVRDEMSGPMAAAAQKGVAAVDALAKSDEKLAQSSQKVTQSTVARMSATKQAELAIRAEADADNFLQSKMAQLNQEYARLQAVARQQIQTTGQITEDTLKAAAAVKEKGEALRFLEGKLSAVTGGMISMAPQLLKLNLLFAAASFAVEGLVDAFKNADTSQRALAEGATDIQMTSLLWARSIDKFKEWPPVLKQIASGFDTVRAYMNFEGVAAVETAKKEQRLIDLGPARLGVLHGVNASLATQWEISAKVADAEERHAGARQRALDTERSIAEAKRKSAEEDNALLQDFLKDGEGQRKQNEREEQREKEAREKAAAARAQVDREMADVRKREEAAEKAGMEATMRRQAELAQSVGSAMGSAMGALINGTERADEVVAKMVLNVGALLAKAALLNALGMGFGAGFGGGLANAAVANRARSRASTCFIISPLVYAKTLQP